MGDGEGHFSLSDPFGTGDGPRSLSVGDFNGDGVLDLATANYNSKSVSIILGTAVAPATLGSYSNTSIVSGANAIIAPSAAPIGATKLVAYTNGNFTGLLTAYPATGVVRVTDAKQAGIYIVTVKATGLGGCTTTTSFNLTVTNPNCSEGQFGAKTDFDAGSSPTSVSFGDFNGDGKQDLVVANYFTDNISILLGNGAGGFGAKTDFGTGNNPNSVSVGDFNRDGKQDLAVANISSSSVSILLGNGNGTFGAKTDFITGSNPFSVSVGDFNGDGKQDLAVVNFSSNTVSILLGNGAGGFGAKTDFGTGNEPTSLSVGDFNGDGKQDLAVANNSSSSISILIGDGAGGFGAKTDFPSGDYPYSISVGDFNGDSKQDLAVANSGSDNVSILLGNGTGGFGAKTDFATGSGPYSVSVGDFNGDGKQDVAVANNSSANLSILLGNGAGAFGAKTDFANGDGPNSISVGDFNGDGVHDLATANSGSNNVSILLGQGLVWYFDADNDNYYTGSGISQCTSPGTGYKTTGLTGGGDCDDANSAVNPGATEICNGKDDNCNGLIDDGLSLPCTAPVVTAPTVTQPTCVLQTGRIIVKATGSEPMQYSINNGVTFSNIANFPNLAPGNYFIVVRFTSNPNYQVSFANNPVVINPVPPLAAPTAIAGPVGVCRNTTEVFSVAPVAGVVSYQWTLPFNATGTSTTNSISVTFKNTFSGGNISVRAINACGQSPLFTRNIEYYGAKPAQPAAITGQTVGLCGTRTYSIASIAKTNNYIWVNPAGTSIISGQGTTSIVLSFGNSFKSGTLSVAAANCKGTSNARTLVLNRNPEVPASITGPNIGVCENSTQAYSCGLVAGATLYTWVVPAGAVINSGQGTNAISVTFPAGFVSGDIKVASGTVCGSGTQRVLNVISIPKIPATISGPVSVCPNATGIVFSTNAVAGVTYNWTVPSGATITSGQGTPSITVNWGDVAGQVKVTGSNVCGTSGLRNLAVSLLACGAPEITMAKVEESTVVANKLSIQLWPNPARDVLMVTLDEFVPNQKMELMLMQADGKVQTAQSLIPTMQGQLVRMDVSRMAAGYYILVVKQAGKIINRQVVILR